MAPLSRRLSVILPSVRVMCWFRAFRLADVSYYFVVGSRLVLVLGVPIGSGFVSIMLVRVRCYIWAFCMAVLAAFSRCRRDLISGHKRHWGYRGASNKNALLKIGSGL